MRKTLTILFSIFTLLVLTAEANGAEIKLVKLDVEKGKEQTRVQMKFNRPVEKHPPIDFFRNVIQLTFENIQAWPSQEVKIPVNGLEKALAYQFDPKTARVRIMVEGDATSWKGKTKMEMIGEELTLSIPNTVSMVKENHYEDVVKKTFSAQKSPDSASRNSVATVLPRSSEEQEIIREVIAGNQNSESSNANTKAHFENTDSVSSQQSGLLSGEKTANVDNSPTSSMGVIEPLGMKSFGRTFIALFAVVALIVGFVFVFKKFTAGNSKFMNLMPGRKGRVIDVVESKFLGPKRSLNLVKVADKYILIGIAGESITNLLVMDDSKEIQKYLEGGNQDEDFEKEMVYSKKPIEGQQELNLKGGSNWGPVVDRLFQRKKEETTFSSTENLKPNKTENMEFNIGTGNKMGAAAYGATSAMNNSGKLAANSNTNDKVRSRIKNRVKELRTL